MDLTYGVQHWLQNSRLIWTDYQTGFVVYEMLGYAKLPNNYLIGYSLSSNEITFYLLMTWQVPGKEWFYSLEENKSFYESENAIALSTKALTISKQMLKNLELSTLLFALNAFAQDFDELFRKNDVEGLQSWDPEVKTPEGTLLDTL